MDRSMRASLKIGMLIALTATCILTWYFFNIACTTFDKPPQGDGRYVLVVPMIASTVVCLFAWGTVLVDAYDNESRG